MRLFSSLCVALEPFPRRKNLIVTLEGQLTLYPLGVRSSGNDEGNVMGGAYTARRGGDDGAGR